MEAARGQVAPQRASPWGPTHWFIWRTGVRGSPHPCRACSATVRLERDVRGFPQNLAFPWGKVAAKPPDEGHTEGHLTGRSVGAFFERPRATTGRPYENLLNHCFPEGKTTGIPLLRREKIQRYRNTTPKRGLSHILYLSILVS